MYLAWRYGGQDPFRLFHGLGADGRPWSGGEPITPARPDRYRNLIYGFAMQAAVEEAALAGAKGG